jgi:hypothetical protein
MKTRRRRKKPSCFTTLHPREQRKAASFIKCEDDKIVRFGREIRNLDLSQALSH